MANSRSRRSSRSVGRFDYRALTLIVFSFVMLLFIIIGPKTPVHRALNATGDGEGSWEGLVISEVMSDNESALPDENGTFCDWLEIWNSSDEVISLENVSLSNRSDRSKFIFPAQVLAPGEKVIVYCDSVNRNTAGEAYHAKFKLSSLGCTVFMFDPSGKQIDSVTVPTLNVNESYSRMEDGRFEVTDLYSPGYPNTEDGHILYLANYTIEADTLYINEVMAAPRSGLRDEDGELSDWLELYNASNERIYLRNYALSNNGAKLLKWFFPDDAYIEPGQYYVVFCSGKDRDGAETGYPHTNFRLSAEKETIYLSNRLGSLVDVMTWDNLSVDCSYGRVPGSNARQVFTLATPGAPNNSEGAALADKYLRAINKTGIYITEVMSSNDVIKAASDSPNKDWVELYNSTTAAVDVSGWGLSDNINWPRKWQFPEGTVLWPGQYKIVMLDGADGVSAGGTLHTSFRLLRAGGEVITLSDATGYVLDKIALPLIPTDYSYGRTLGLGSFFYYDTPTPGGANGTGFGGFTEAPAFMTRGGLFSSNVEVEIVVPAGTTVRYTTDGTVPTVNNGTVYTGPFTITGTTAVRARAFVGGDRKPSDTITATYVLKTYYSLPVVCLVTDPDNLWNESTGIFAAGAGIDLASYSYIPFKHPSPVYRIQKEAGVKVSSYAEMYRQGETDPVFSQGVEIGIIGQYSLDMPQKSIKIHAKARYGSKYINGAVFEDRPFTQYRALVLRNSGNDCVWTRMVDGVQSRLADKIGTTVVHQAWQPVIVYINGQYWGHYNLRERVGEYMVAQHEGVPLNEAKSIDVLESNGTSKSQINNGSNEEWK